MTLNLIVPAKAQTDFMPRITVIGVGGGGTNAVDNMIAANLQGVEFVVANTDAQQLMHSRADRRIQLGPHLTQGLGAGAKPEIGKAAAEEAADELFRHLDGAHMVFITAGMGGGTGTGAAPVIARMARERGILTVGVVTKPFGFEGVRRGRAADEGIEELQQYVDTLIVIPNQNLFRMATERTTWKEAFKMADQVLYMGVRGVTDLMMVHGLINLDFADVKAVMGEMGKAMMGTGEADGDNRAIRAAEAAINNPLLEDTSMAGAKGLLINITGGEDLSLFEVDQAVTRIRDEVDEEANVIFGSAIDESLNGRIRVSVFATGISSPHRTVAKGPRLVAIGGAMPEPAPIPVAAAFMVGQTSAQTSMPQLRQTSSLRMIPVTEPPKAMLERAQPIETPLDTGTDTKQDPLNPGASALGAPDQALPKGKTDPDVVVSRPTASIFSRVTGAFRRRVPQASNERSSDYTDGGPSKIIVRRETSSGGAIALGSPDTFVEIPALLRRALRAGGSLELDGGATRVAHRTTTAWAPDHQKGGEYLVTSHTSHVAQPVFQSPPTVSADRGAMAFRRVMTVPDFDNDIALTDDQSNYFDESMVMPVIYPSRKIGSYR